MVGKKYEMVGVCEKGRVRDGVQCGEGYSGEHEGGEDAGGFLVGEKTGEFHALIIPRKSANNALYVRITFCLAVYYSTGRNLNDCIIL